VSRPPGPAGGSVECVFESMGATDQPHPGTQPPTQRMWTTFCSGSTSTRATHAAPSTS
jgi:hypothetical protein